MQLKKEINYMMKKYPIIEPRLMNTRIKLEENIPLSLFEYSINCSSIRGKVK